MIAASRGWIVAIAVAFAGTCFGDACLAQSPSFSAIDPYDYVAPPGSANYVRIEPRWQMHPFDVGYDLLMGYRPIYTGARQPIGHEIMMTHGGNGYVYRPVYAPSPGYHFTPAGTMVIEQRGRYPDASPWDPFPAPVTKVEARAVPNSAPAISPTAREF